MSKMRSGFGLSSRSRISRSTVRGSFFQRARICFALSFPSHPRPEQPISSERSPFCNASLKFRPILIVSPTDFIEIPRVSSAPWNFSKVNRGILTTQ